MKVLSLVLTLLYSVSAFSGTDPLPGASIAIAPSKINAQGKIGAAVVISFSGDQAKIVYDLLGRTYSSEEKLNWGTLRSSLDKSMSCARSESGGQDIYVCDSLQVI